MEPLETDINDEKERKLRLKDRVLQEIISSEVSYLSQLDMLLDVITISFR